MTPKARFYKHVAVAEHDRGFVVQLDGKPVRTPQSAVLAVPVRALADAIAAEWQSPGETLDPSAMPLTRLAFAAIDAAAAHRQRLAEDILGYGRSDLLCYRAETPSALVERQALAWDPLLAWARDTLGATLAVGAGIAFIEQDAGTARALTAAVDACDAFHLVALHGATSLTGSIVLAFAVLRGRLTAAEAFELSTLDETFQAETWGRDAEDEARTAKAAAELAAIERFLDLSRPRPHS